LHQIKVLSKHKKETKNATEATLLDVFLSFLADAAFSLKPLPAAC